MKFEIWTFLFQIINFAVLLYILKRLLYKPIREIIERRRSLITRTMEEAENIKKEAEELKAKNQEELAGLKELRSRMLDSMKKEVAEERKSLLLEAGKEAERIIEKEKGLFDSEKKRFETELKEMSIKIVSLFATSLLKDITDEELHRAIYHKLLKEIEPVVSHIRGIAGKDEFISIDLVTAFPLKEDEITKVRDALESSIPKRVRINARVDTNLIAGIRIMAYDMVYDFSLTGQIEALKMKLKESI